MRAIRGAICAHDNSKDAIYQATQRLLGVMMERNRLGASDVVAAFFTMTPDLNADFPAYAARDMGWVDVPMLGAQESLVPGAPHRAIRALVLAEGDAPVKPVYLGRAAAMRPDLAEPGDAERWDADRPSDGTAGSAKRLRGRLLVVGLGLVGGSLAAGIRRSGLFEAVQGFDVDRDTAHTALRRGLVDDLATDLEVAGRQADLIVLATPVSEIVRLLRRLGRHLEPGVVVTDVGSTKRNVVDAMSTLPVGVGAVGGHPMAGSTSSGAGAADPDLFRGSRWAVVPAQRTDERSLAAVEEVARELGARPVRMSADDHDRIVAVTSHLPAVLAVGLTELAGRTGRDIAQEAFLAGPGFADSTRLAGGDPVMTSQMLAENSDNLRIAVEKLTANLHELVEYASDDSATLASRLTEARGLRASLAERSAAVGHRPGAGGPALGTIKAEESDALDSL
jgi:monofunctional chorismate mutase